MPQNNHNASNYIIQGISEAVKEQWHEVLLIEFFV